jgi:Tol biopolymer transport system component
MAANGTGAHAIIDDAQSNGSAAWSPDGALLLYSSIAGGNTDLCVVRLRDGVTTDLLRGDANDYLGTWTDG